MIDAGWNFTGASDHLVSEALYLDDPEGNGIEIYRDRPRDEWRYEGGQLAMATLPLDLDGVMARARRRTTSGRRRRRDAHRPRAPAGRADPRRPRPSTTSGLGLDVTTSRYPGALFMSAGGYHHHIGTNTWASANAPAPPVGLARAAPLHGRACPTPPSASASRRSCAPPGTRSRDVDGGVEAVDPSGNRALLTTDAAAA